MKKYFSTFTLVLAAVIAGLQAEEVIEHGEALHELMEDHERFALITMGIFTAVLGYKLFRRARLSAGEELALRGLSMAGFVGVIWTAWLGGKMAFEHGAGVTTAAMQAEIQDRAQSHHHHEGEAGAAEHEH